MVSRAERRRESKRIKKYGEKCRWPRCVSRLNRSLCIDNHAIWVDCERPEGEEHQNKAKEMAGGVQKTGQVPEVSETMRKAENDGIMA